MAAARRILRRAARVDAPVVLEGETGTGKTLAARWIHDLSSRAEGAFVSVNCASIPEALFESELFGHRRGAFTGAVESRAGLFETASGGTLFLDEVAEMPAAQQAKLLTVLEEGTVRRVGETRARSVDVRVVAATAKDLDRAVRAGSYRPDLFHRIALLRCRLPPLRAREGDLALLAHRFLDELGRKHLGRPASVTAGAVQALHAHAWPGNVRELAHVLEAALILTGRTRLDREEIEAVLEPNGGGAAVAAGPERETVGGAVSGDPGCGAPPGRAAGPPVGGRYSFYGTEEEEREMIRRVVQRCRGNRTRAAAELGMSRSTLRSRLRRYGL
jgi:two-component system response regulator PilR (NtrC family)